MTLHKQEKVATTISGTNCDLLQVLSCSEPRLRNFDDRNRGKGPLYETIVSGG